MNYISIRNTDSILMQKSIIRFFTKISCKKADHIISISKQVKDDLVENFNINKNKITTIYNPALKIEFGKQKMKIDENFYNNNKVVVNVGRLTNQKGQWHLIKAFSYVVKKVPNAKLLILGQGELDKYLKTIIKIYNMEKNIFLLGFVNNPYDYIKKSKCFVFSSLFEGLGNSLLEALACGIPIISTDCVSGPREILAPETDYRIKVKDRYIEEKYGILCPVFTEVKDDILSKEELIFGTAIYEMITNEKKQRHYKKMSKERAKHFDINNITKQWIDVLER